MTIDKMKQTIFNRATLGDWEQTALKSLKGKTLDSLSTKTLEDIILKPLYSLADAAFIPVSQTDIVRQAKNSSEWSIAQLAEGGTSEEVLMDIKESLGKGNDVIHYKVEKEHVWNAEQIEEWKGLLSEHKAILDVTNNPSFLDHFTELNGLVKGAKNATTLHARTTFLNGSSIHQAGGDAVSELASVLVQADSLARETSIGELVQKAFVQFSVDTNFFMEIAKIRAFRVLWQAFGEGFGQTNLEAIPVHVETSLRSFSVLDSYVNILRAGNSALAAVLGGADSVTTYPHDYLTKVTPTSNRIARNMQLVLKEETHIQRVIDAAGGSYYVESLTKELVEKAWTYFFELMKEATLEDRESKLLARADEKWQQQLALLATRKKSLIGTNIYANPADILPEAIKQIDFKRLAEPFEQLRQAFQQKPLNTTIIPYGLLKEYKARMDFVSGYLVALGISPTVAPENLKPFDLQKWIDEQRIDYVIFVGNDEQTAGLVPALLNEQLSVPMDVAGKCEEYEDWLEAGLSGRIFAGQSLLEKGQQLLALAQKEDSNVNA
ncbi:methylmalonyl-CoA mutase family protein [Psychrobacillus sp. NEAU-3TGS]|uniref:methylmalonyl-CoA mutase family protein n=1 Tax=Psychrobacillus sp. NEAU-3TGS TaxID=2995412 RepID=UPI0024978D98|nr:methylmalonyl-CoA mutase family protein [Psychrobacillus sp. NEAU-3TGS]MDI2587916.1 methylmalonyl-CoA mutase family protein [Psychrobacillus sp. NEAU-3TGS]